MQDSEPTVPLTWVKKEQDCKRRKAKAQCWYYWCNRPKRLQKAKLQAERWVDWYSICVLTDDIHLIRTRNIVHNVLGSQKCEHLPLQWLTPPNINSNTFTLLSSGTFDQSSATPIGLGPFLHHDLWGHLDYISHALCAAKIGWGLIDQWALSFQRCWSEATQQDDAKYIISKGRTLIELGHRGMVLMLHMMDGLEGNVSPDEYHSIWQEALKLSRAIYEGVIHLEQQVHTASASFYNSGSR